MSHLYCLWPAGGASSIVHLQSERTWGGIILISYGMTNASVPEIHLSVLIAEVIAGDMDTYIPHIFL